MGERSNPPMPQSVGRYQIQGTLGTGAMGAVYKGYDPLIKRTLAIKTIRLDIPRGSEDYRVFLERFYQEARISGTLSHPNIVTLFDIGEDNGLPFLAFEYIEGETIELMLKQGARFKPERVVALVSQIAAALDYAHSKEIIHRDIKPANLIVYEGDKVKITDFGIAKLADSNMTRQGQLLGTPSYMSPEQALGEKLDGRSDIFSLGVVAFEMMSGQQPFPGNNITTILYKLVHADPVEPDNLEMNGLVPQKWHEVFGRVLAKKRAARYQTAADFVRDLELVLGSWFAGLGLPEEVPGGPTVAMEALAEPPAPGGDPAIVVSIDEVTRAMPAGPEASGEEEEIVEEFDDTEYPPTVALRAPHPPPSAAAASSAPPRTEAPRDEEGGEEEDLPPTVAFVRPSGPERRAAAPPPVQEEEEEELPPTVAMVRPPVGAKRAEPPPAFDPTVVMPAPGPGAPPPAAPPAAPRFGTMRQTTMPAYRGKPGVALPPRRGSTGKAGAVKSHPPGVVQPPVPAPQPPPAPLPEPAESPDLVASLPPSRPGRGLVIGAGLALVAVGAGLVAFALRGRGTGTDQTASGATLEVASQPAGAEILVDWQARGKAPATVGGLAPGSHDVVAELDGYEPALQRVEVTEAEPAKVSLTLTAAKEAMGEADILSRPAGATVSLNGKKIGQAPQRDMKLRVGVHRFQFTTAGFEPCNGLFLVEAGKPGRLEARLRPAGSPPASGAACATGAMSLEPPGEPGKTAKDAAGAGRTYTEDEVDVKPQRTSGDHFRPELKPGETKSITLSLIVTETGAVTEVEIVESSGSKEIDSAEAAAVGKWKFQPGEKQGAKVRVKLSRKVTFK